MRVFITMLGYNTEKMIEGALKNLEDTTTDSEHRSLIKTLFNCGFPGNDRARLKQLAVKYGWWFTDIPNEGVVENHNVAIHNYCHMEKGDYYATFDPDVRMREKGWVSAMVEALESDRDTVFVSPSMNFHHEKWCQDQHGMTMKSLPSGLRVARYRALVAWPSGLYKGEWLACRPRHFAAANKYYGWSEHCEYDRMLAARKTWVQLVDFHDDHLGSDDPLYQQWKVESAGGRTAADYGVWKAGR